MGLSCPNVTAGKLVAIAGPHLSWASSGAVFSFNRIFLIIFFLAILIFDDLVETCTSFTQELAVVSDMVLICGLLLYYLWLYRAQRAHVHQPMEKKMLPESSGMA